MPAGLDRDLYVTTEYATFLLVMDGGVCTDAPPIARWCVGKPADVLERYWRRRGASLKYLPARRK